MQVIRAALAERGMTLVKLAPAVGASTSSLSRYTRHVRNWDPAVLKQVARKLWSHGEALIMADRAVESLVEALSDYRAGKITAEELRREIAEAQDALVILDATLEGKEKSAPKRR